MPRLVRLVPFALTAPLACTTSENSSTGAWPPPPKPPLSPAPERVKVQHVLVAFRGTGTAATRSKEDAEALAREIYGRATRGESFEGLMKRSDDTGGGTYGMSNGTAALRPGEFPRSKMVAGFGDVAFSLAVGEVGVCVYDPVKSPFGWHIVKRVE